MKRGELEPQAGWAQPMAVYLPQTDCWAESRRQRDRPETDQQAEGKRAEPGSKGGRRRLSTHAVAEPGTGEGGRRRAEQRTYRSTDWRAERARLLVKGADRALGGCRSSMDLLQDRSLSNAPSSALSRPSKSNLEHERTHVRTHGQRGRTREPRPPARLPPPFGTFGNKKQG